MAQVTTGEKVYGLPVKVAVVLLIFVQMLQSTVNPSLPGIMASFPGLDTTTYQTIINIATLIMIPAALITGPCINKLGYKTTGIIAMVLALIGGVAPAFVHPSVEFMIFERGIFGIGYGMVYTLSIAAAGAFWRGKATSAVIGAVNFGAGLAGIIYGLASTAVVPFGWEAVYYLGFIIVPILIYYIAVMPNHSELAAEKTNDTGKKEKLTFASFGTSFWLYILGMALTLACVVAFMNNIAMVVIGNGIDPNLIGLIMTGFTAGMMIGGVLYPFIYGALKRAAMAVYLLVDTICFLVIMFIPGLDFFILTALGVIIGIVFANLNASWEDMANKKVVAFPLASAMGSSIFIAVAGVAQFLSPFFLSACAGLMGQTQENPLYQYYPAVVVLAVGFIFLLVMAIIKKNKVDYERDEVPADMADREAAGAEAVDANVI